MEFNTLLCTACAKSVGARPVLWGSGEMFGRQCWISVNVALTLGSFGATIPPARAAPTPTLLLKYIPPTSHSVNSIQGSCSDSWSILSFLFLFLLIPNSTLLHHGMCASCSVEIEHPLGERRICGSCVSRHKTESLDALCNKLLTCALRQWMMC